MGVDDQFQPPSGAKRLAFWVITVSVPALFLIIAVQAYYLYAYLTFPAYYCGSFAALDPEIGWVLKPETESCIGGLNPDTGETAFEVPVFVNRDGARAPSADAETPVGDILIIGDSWSFGYGIPWQSTFAAQLMQRHGRQAALFASPAYSGAQAMLLGDRAAEIIRPKTIVYLEMGFWTRAVCTGNQRPTGILKPCFWTNADGVADLIQPGDGRVASAREWGFYPGGMLGAGQKTLAYFLISRPLAKIRQSLVKLGLIDGFGDDFGPYATESELDAIRLAQFKTLQALAKKNAATLLLIDPMGTYEALHHGPEVVYLGPAVWNAQVAEPMNALSEQDARVPHDNHFGPGVHILIADLIAAHLPPE